MAHCNGTAVPERSNQIALRSEARASLRGGGFRAWRRLEAEDRFTLVETALKIPANDFANELPSPF